MANREVIILDGESLTTEKLVKLSTGNYQIDISSEAWDRVAKSREVVDKIVREKRVVYGISTGFGKFENVVISPDKLSLLQENLIRSHSAGVGKPFSPEHTRKLLALRINVLVKGCSGVTKDTLKKLVAAFNASCLSWIPEKGTVGACGDLAPLAHLALGMMGEGKMWSPETGWGDAGAVLKKHGLQPVQLQAKEGLAVINGAQLITALGAEAVERARKIARQADIICALTLEVLEGVTAAYKKAVHVIRPHKGQGVVAGRLRSLLHSDIHPSQITQAKTNKRVQDAYSLRCTPQVHGVVNDTIDFVSGVITTEMNSATDNPLVIREEGEIVSAGNFHGEYPAKVLDYLAIGVHELANISERRTERLINPSLSGNLPAFLVKEGGLNSGFMIAHCTAAALVSENKVLTHPASVDSLPTSAGQEDHVSMGGFSARKALQVVEHVEQVLAIELLAACQGMEFRKPNKTTAPLQAVYNLVRTVVKPLDGDRVMSTDIDAVTKLLQTEQVWEAARPFMENFATLEQQGRVGRTSRDA